MCLLVVKENSRPTLSHAYQQLLLDKKSRELLTLSTHKRLYRSTRLVFGVASAPGIFQREIGKISLGMENVTCYLDDILIAGRD